MALLLVFVCSNAALGKSGGWGGGRGIEHGMKLTSDTDIVIYFFLKSMDLVIIM